MEPYVAFQCANDRFDAVGRNQSLAASSCTISNFTAIKYGVTRSLSLQAIPTIARNKDARKWGNLGFGDLPVDIMWRVLDEDSRHRYPTLSFLSGISFPTGRYQKLDSMADAMGSGGWQLRIGLAAQSLQTMPNNRPLRLRGWLAFHVPLGRVSVRGLNAYGLPASMASTVRVGMSGQGGVAGEYGVDRHWVLAFDLVRNWSNGNRIYRSRRSAEPSSGDWEVAPAVEYNWSAKLGIIAGAVIPMVGHNEAREFVGQAAVNIVF
ncbi:hypothetical protein HLH34_15175 [Gluconacetobacter azotocaptans]|uniref:Uncharacterized protein n=1 Tax=Gluconacetobacter azotocaptans TaxID=142834 RepID=A0A7W4JUY3_9PROT|nr:hypothetical protein [Gluconacetobacter azotocaptans]MBB2191285.1 hypothetical protein [Gluconacetobacter azotocaptans]MBM9402073.1 hypothetical protein [Gluconacetobacter azotocaptans]